MAATGFVLLRLLVLAHGDISVFVDAGTYFVAPHPHLHLQTVPGFGFDGQFAYRFALDPSDLRPSGHGVRLDSALREERILYPAIVWLVSLGGRTALVPTALVVVNVAAIGALAWAGGVLARQAGRLAVWGLLLAAPWCYLLTIGRDLHEVVAGAFLAWALVCLRAPVGVRRQVAATVLLSCGVLTRESVMVVVLALAVTAALTRRPLRPAYGDLVWLVPGATFVAWQLICRAAYGEFPLVSGSSANLGAPFVGVGRGVALWFGDRGLLVDVGVQFLLLVVLTATVVPALRRPSCAPTHERVAWWLWIGYALCQSFVVWNEAGEFRGVADLQLLSAVLVLSATQRRPTRYACLAGVGWAITAVRRIAVV